MAKKQTLPSSKKVGSNSLLLSQLSPSLSLLLICMAVIAVYYHTLSAPFYLDDFSSIRENFAIRDLSNLDRLLASSNQRFIGYLTFALNYSIHEYELAGYHLTNIGIHITTSMVVFWLCDKILSIDVVNNQLPLEAIKWLPLVSALIFALHPLQIQAVTYIVQRLAALAALFYLLSLVSYLQFRLSSNLNKKVIWLSLAFFFALAAFYTKQNSVTLPGAILLIEIYLFNLWGRKALAAGVALAFTFFLVVVYYSNFVDNEFFASLSQATLETTLVSRAEYLAIQMGVLWTYIAKFFLPFNLHLDMNIPVSSFSNPMNWLFAAGHIAILAMAIFCRNSHRLLGFALAFYYLAHSVESSIIPIRDFAFEHRTYLPNFAMSMILAYLFLVLVPRYLKLKKVEFPICLFLVFLSVLSWQRNAVWADPELFFRNEIAANPEVLRSYGMLGEYYLRTNQNEKAVEIFLEGLRVDGGGFDRQTNTRLAFLQNTILALDSAERDEEAFEILSSLPWQELRNRDVSKFLTLRGNIYAQRLEIVAAQSDFEEALALNSRNLDAKLSYGKVLYMQARMDESELQFTEFLSMDANHPLANEARSLLDAISVYKASQP